MIAIGEAQFSLPYRQLSDRALRGYATRLFKDFDRSASRLIPLRDYALHLSIEQGSIKGVGAVLATFGALYVGIAEFGSFVQGVREISSLTKSVGKELLNSASSNVRVPQSSMTSKRASSAKLGEIERILRSVARGQLEPSDASEAIIELFREEGEDIPPPVAADIEFAVSEIRLDPQQLDLALAPTQDLTLLPARQPSRPAPKPREMPFAENRNRLRVEVRREHKGGRMTVTVVQL